MRALRNRVDVLLCILVHVIRLFFSSLLDATSQGAERDQKLERLLLWISNCVQLLLFLKHTFQLPELTTTETRTGIGYTEKSPRKEHGKQPSPRKEDSAKHAMAQLVTGLEEIIMFCFQQSVYTITKVRIRWLITCSGKKMKACCVNQARGLRGFCRGILSAKMAMPRV